MNCPCFWFCSISHHFLHVIPRVYATWVYTVKQGGQNPKIWGHIHTHTLAYWLTAPVLELRSGCLHSGYLDLETWKECHLVKRTPLLTLLTLLSRRIRSYWWKAPFSPQFHQFFFGLQLVCLLGGLESGLLSQNQLASSKGWKLPSFFFSVPWHLSDDPPLASLRAQEGGWDFLCPSNLTSSGDGRAKHQRRPKSRLPRLQLPSVPLPILTVPLDGGNVCGSGRGCVSDSYESSGGKK